MDKKNNLFNGCGTFILLILIGIIIALCAFNIRVNAAPLNDTTVSVNATITSLKKYVDNKMAQDAASDNVLIDGVEFFGNQLISAFGLPGELNDYVAATGVPIASVAPSDFQQAYNNNDLQWFQATFGITYESDFSNMDGAIEQMTEYIVDSVESDIVIYNCPNPSHVADMVNLYLNAKDVENEIYGQYSNDSGEIFPIYYYRWRSAFRSCSFQNEPSDNVCVDGLVLDSYQSSENWSNFVTNVDFYAHYGYLPEGSPVTIFNFYYNGVKVNAPFYHILQHTSSFPSYLEIWGYDTIRDEGIRCQSALFGTDGDVFLFYRSQAAYLKYNQMSTKSVLPYDFSINFPNTDFSDLDFSQILKVIRDNGVLETHNIQELYKRLNESITQGIQEIVDAQKSTNELLLALLRYYDKNIVQDGKNITDILVSIYNKINDMYSAPDDEDIVAYFDTILEDGSIENRLKHIFPFGYFQDCSDLLNRFAEIPILDPRWEFNVDLLHSETEDYSLIVIDLRDIPEIETFRSIFFFVVLLSLHLGCLFLEYKFLCIFFGGG